MTLRNKRGQESKRELRLKVIEVENDGDRTIFVFDRPRNVKGTGFLVHAHKTGPDDQWLYLPALKRVKRISSSKQVRLIHGERVLLRGHGRRRGGEIHPPVRARRGLWRSSSASSSSASRRARIQAIPASSSGWTGRSSATSGSSISTGATSTSRRWSVEDYRKYLDRFWRAGNISMTNHLTGKSTVLNWKDYKFGTDLDLGDFTQTALKRAR